MSRSIRRGVERVDDRLADLDGDVREAARQRALDRVMRGEGHWTDFEASIDAASLAEYRRDLLAGLPCVVERRSQGGLWPIHDPLDGLRQVAAHLPEEELPADLESFIASSQTDWESADPGIAIGWALARLTLGSDQGMKLRRSCWRGSELGWHLREEVIETARAQNDSDINRAVLALTQPIQDTSGVWCSVPAVQIGGRLSCKRMDVSP